MPDHLHIQRRFGLPRVLQFLDDSRGGQGEDNDDEEWHNRPRRLHGTAAVNLRRFHVVIIRAATETNDRIDEQASHDDENDARDYQDESGKMRNRMRGTDSGAKMLGTRV